MTLIEKVTYYSSWSFISTIFGNKSLQNCKMRGSSSDEKSSSSSKDNGGGILHKIKYAVSLMTIEPMMIVQGIATNISTVPTDQMVLYKICRGIKSFNEKN